MKIFIRFAMTGQSYSFGLKFVISRPTQFVRDLSYATQLNIKFWILFRISKAMN